MKTYVHLFVVQRKMLVSIFYSDRECKAVLQRVQPLFSSDAEVCSTELPLPLPSEQGTPWKIFIFCLTVASSAELEGADRISTKQHMAVSHKKHCISEQLQHIFVDAGRHKATVQMLSHLRSAIMRWKCTAWNSPSYGMEVTN